MYDGEEIQRDYDAAEGEEFNVYSMGLVYASVCSSLGDDATAKRMQALPSGTTQGHSLAVDATFATGQSNPCPCELKPQTHKHYLFTAWETKP